MKILRKNNKGYLVNITTGKLRHRELVERRLGRSLKKTEVVHHRNRIKHDNRINNLLLCKNQAEHYKIHKFTLNTYGHW